MKIREVILRAMAKKITWCQPAEIIGISDRQMRRWYERYQEFGYDGLLESTRTVLAALREVIERRGVFCALYSDRASHFFATPKAGGKIDSQRLTQVGLTLNRTFHLLPKAEF